MATLPMQQMPSRQKPPMQMFEKMSPISSRQQLPVNTLRDRSAGLPGNLHEARRHTGVSPGRYGPSGLPSSWQVPVEVEDQFDLRGKRMPHPGMIKQRTTQRDAEARNGGLPKLGRCQSFFRYHFLSLHLLLNITE